MLKLKNVTIAVALCFYLHTNVPSSCKESMDQLINENIWAYVILYLLAIKTPLSLIWLQRLDEEITLNQQMHVNFNKSDQILKTQL